METPRSHATASGPVTLPAHHGLFYDGTWHAPLSGRWLDIEAPGTGEPLMRVADAGAQDVAAAARAARAGFHVWRATPPLARARILRQMAQRLREHAPQLALLDALDGGNPIAEMQADVQVAAILLDFFAGLVTEIKGDTIPMGPDALNYTEREPVGVVGRIVAFNHPLLFAMGKLAAPLAAGNAVIIKPSAQAPLSALRCAELIADLLPPGVLSVLPGDAEAGAALASCPDIDMVGLVGSVVTGRAVMQGAAARLKPVALELGGKNPFIACADVDPDIAAQAMVDGMNFTWCGQSCGATSRAFVHRDIYAEVCARLAQACARFVPGDPTDPATTMGAMITAAARDRVQAAIHQATADGARLLCGGSIPDRGVPAGGYYVQATVFADVAPTSALACQELFGPVLAVMPWDEEEDLLAAIHSLDVGLTAAVWTADLARAHRLARALDAGYVWINEVGKHFLGAPYGGVKQSGIGRDECLGEMLSFTREKNVHVNLRPVARRA